ncbi:MAG: hypothetical protein ACR2NM_05095 [Bythopirellula sp.]
MESFLRSLDPMTIVTICVPIGIFAAAWAFRMSCAICAVRVPDLLPSAAVVIMILAANFALRIGLHDSNMHLGLGTQLLLLLLTSATIISISVRTSIASALAVIITHVFFCSLMYFGVNEVGQILL